MSESEETQLEELSRHFEEYMKYSKENLIEKIADNVDAYKDDNMIYFPCKQRKHRIVNWSL